MPVFYDLGRADQVQSCTWEQAHWSKKHGIKPSLRSYQFKNTMKKLNIAYFGVPSFSSLFLEKLITNVSINQLIDTKFVITQPDRPVGRKQILTPTPVKLTAQKYNIPMFDNLKSQSSKLPPSSRSAGLQRASKTKSQNLNLNKKISDLRCGFDICDLSFDIDLALVFAFGEIIPKELLSLPRLGFINIHPSLLPKYRGPSPIAYPLINGDTVTGVTLIKMDEQIDHGPIIAQEKLDILPDDRRPDLEIKLTGLAFKMIKKLLTVAFEAKAKISVLRQSLGGPPARSVGVKRSKNMISSLWQIPLIEQNHKQATYTKLLKKSDGFVPFDILKKAISNQKIQNSKVKSQKSKSKVKIFNLFRGLYPWPGLWTLLPNGKRLRITSLTMKQTNNLAIESVQLEGKTEVDFETFNRAYKIF